MFDNCPLFTSQGIGVLDSMRTHLNEAMLSSILLNWFALLEIFYIRRSYHIRIALYPILLDFTRPIDIVFPFASILYSVSGTSQSK